MNLKFLKCAMILFMVFLLNTKNCFADLLSESFLSPVSNIDLGSLQKTFTYLVNEQTYSEYKAIFEINDQDKPRRDLKARDLEDFLQVITDIRLILEMFSQGNAFKGIMNQADKETIDDFLSNHPDEIELLKDSGIKPVLSAILERALAQLAARQRAVPSLAETMYKELIFRLKTKLETAAGMLKTGMPIKSINFNQEILSYLKPETLNRIIENINWQNQDPDDYSGQRKIILNLDKPIVLENGKIINSIEIKGVVYRKDEVAVTPLQERFNTIKVPRLDKNNLTALKKRVHLKGGMPFAAAKREYMILEKLYAQGNYQYDYPIGYGRYKNYTFQGKQFGFIITGVENSRRTRMGDWFFDNYQEIFDLLTIDKVRFANLAVELFEVHETFLRHYGRELRRFHDSGFYHGYPHTLNVSWDKEFKNIVLNDFEASKLISHLPVEKRVGYRLIDLSSAYAHFIYFLTNDRDLMELAAFSEGMNHLNNPFRYFLQGYFGNDLPNFNFDGFMSEAIYPAVVSGVDVINDLDQDIVSKLLNIEGADYKRVKYIDQIVFDAQGFVNELACQEAI
ncbi:MAG: hypothetical protein V1747_07855 [Candidatus Omnitrophota bacterium]